MYQELLAAGVQPVAEWHSISDDVARSIYDFWERCSMYHRLGVELSFSVHNIMGRRLAVLVLALPIRPTSDYICLRTSTAIFSLLPKKVE